MMDEDDRAAAKTNTLNNSRQPRESGRLSQANHSNLSHTMTQSKRSVDKKEGFSKSGTGGTIKLRKLPHQIVYKVPKD